jgi:hypothetical protein
MHISKLRFAVGSEAAPRIGHVRLQLQGASPRFTDSIAFDARAYGAAERAL